MSKPVPPEQAGPAPPGPASTAAGPAKPPLVLRWLRGFGAFWWDFLVGDTPEVLIGVLVALGLVVVLVRAASLNAVAVVAFPVLVVLLLVGSSLRARPRR